MGTQEATTDEHEEQNSPLLKKQLLLLQKNAMAMQLQQYHQKRRKTMERIVSEFLTGKNLRKMFSHLCNNASGQVTDPISDTASMMLTCPVQMIITEVGVALFKDRPTHLYPFSAMDPAQLYFVEELVRECLMQCDIAQKQQDNNPLQQHQQQQLMSSSSRNLLPFYHLHHHAVVQMGGGCILYLHHHQNIQGMGSSSSSSSSDPERKRCKKESGGASYSSSTATEASNAAAAAAGPILLQPAEVLKAMCDCILASGAYGDDAVRQSICNIVLQRVVSMTNVVSREDQRTVDAYYRSLSSSGNSNMTVDNNY